MAEPTPDKKEETTPKELSTESLLPAKEVVASAPTAPVAAIAAAPQAVKRSMPMALSICLGILLAVLAGVFFYRLTWLLLILYLSFIAATVLEPFVHWLTRHGIRRGFAAVLVSLTALSVVIGVLTLVAMGIMNESAAMAQKMSKAPERIETFVNNIRSHMGDVGERLGEFHLADEVKKIMPEFSTLWSNALVGVEIISGLVIMFFIVLYMLADGADHLKAMRGVFPKDSRLEATKLFNAIAKAHRGWAFASVANVCSATILLSTGLWLVGIPGALLLGLIAGLGELIPNIGPFLGALPALLLTLLAEPDKFWYVVAVFVVLQTIQSYTISPMMLRFSVELPVLVTIISVLVFGTLFGFLGVVVAIPLVADMVVIWAYLNARREKDTTDYDASNAPTNGERASVKLDRKKIGPIGLFRRNSTDPARNPI